MTNFYGQFIGFGAGGAAAPFVRPWGGTSHGYRAGGYNSASGYGWPNNNTDTIDKYAYASDGDASDVGNLTARTDGNACHSSETYGYAATGDHPVTTTIWKWAFASDGDASAYSGDLTGGGWASTGTYSKENGYTSGRNNSGPFFDTVDKFNFASENDATDVGNLTVGRSYTASQSSETHGHCSGGSGGGRRDEIDRWAFASDGDATDVGDILAGNAQPSGSQSQSYGYMAGGQTTPGGFSNVIQKFAFSSSADSTDVADLASGANSGGGSSSTTHGYHTGGGQNTTAGSDIIQKYGTASDGDATDIGNLTESIIYTAGCQY